MVEVFRLLLCWRHGGKEVVSFCENRENLLGRSALVTLSYDIGAYRFYIESWTLSVVES